MPRCIRYNSIPLFYFNLTVASSTSFMSYQRQREHPLWDKAIIVSVINNSFQQHSGYPLLSFRTNDVAIKLLISFLLVDSIVDQTNSSSLQCKHRKSPNKKHSSTRIGRRLFTGFQILELESVFVSKPYLTRQERSSLARKVVSTCLFNFIIVRF